MSKDIYIAEQGNLTVDPSTDMLLHWLTQTELYGAEHGAAIMKALADRHAKHNKAFFLKNLRYPERNMLIVTGDDHFVYLQFAKPNGGYSWGYSRREWDDDDMLTCVKQQSDNDNAIISILLAGKKPLKWSLTPKHRTAKQTAKVLFDRVKDEGEDIRGVFREQLNAIRENPDGMGDDSQFNRTVNAAMYWMFGEMPNVFINQVQYASETYAELITLMLMNGYCGEGGVS